MAWKNDQRPHLHGCVYGLYDRILMTIRYWVQKNFSMKYTMYDF